ncbi:hypothetical protein bsdtb5_17910 [Anaeromicropila herbilytica]|uniref:Ribosomal RNA large subunit methyltransferase K/L-like methyltransferase domain-containing protein n=2 Tax=Anaeromicropila herbilytica TaxID=2785025 RepID=A0A7R7EKY6_9FIRM|nr:hypothetical protein bsdtb5_17910 [Anaeromicropila herbilytica]
MIRELFDKIINREDTRKNLIELKQLLKEENNKRAFLYYAGSELHLLCDLLKEEDAKIRKNAALIMGEIGQDSFLELLMDAYESEEQLFVKSSYLTAISKLDFKKYNTKLKTYLNDLTNKEWPLESRKHVDEEIRILTSMMLELEKPKFHKFVGYDKTMDVVLLTNRNHKDITLKQLEEVNKKEFNAGVIVRSTDLNKILKIRTFTEMLFLIKGMNSLNDKPTSIAETISKSNLLTFLKQVHEGDSPFYFRIELKSKMELDKKSAFTKKIASELERLTKRELINSTSNYEIEIRLIANKDGGYNTLLKLFTLKDTRFSYRKNSIANSIHPVNAALCANLAKAYLEEEAQVLDPFCGVGTMLIERNKLAPANPMYGIDIYGDAIDMARENASLDKTIINYINRDFFDFKHEYLFDEIITNMPNAKGRKDDDDIKKLYHSFFNKIPEILKENGIILLHVKDESMVQKELKNCRFKLEKKWELSKKEETYFYVIRYIG